MPPVADVERIGRYTKGVTPGGTGPAVLIGHFVTARGPAVLRDVAKIHPGGEITDGHRPDGIVVYADLVG
ncbi:hypothetical protein ACIPJK_19020 [Streptomyces roseus]|uniref:hypothetical protein n=1 Tax=Streptomyces roseus TaxID=66430 RepID=UPI00382F0768